MNEEIWLYAFFGKMELGRIYIGTYGSDIQDALDAFNDRGSPKLEVLRNIMPHGTQFHYRKQAAQEVSTGRVDTDVVDA